jgi:hypothetical protein
VRVRNVALLAALVVVAGCASSDPKEQYAGFPGGFETPIKTAVQLGTAPAGDEKPTELLASVDNEIAKMLELECNSILDAALAAYDKERPETGTKIAKENCEVVVEDFAVQAEETAATRKQFEGKVTRFRFTLRRAKARIVPEPTRIEAELYCVERSWAPGDTFNFPRLFRAEVMDRVNKKIYAVADKMALQPRKPQAPRTQ